MAFDPNDDFGMDDFNFDDLDFNIEDYTSQVDFDGGDMVTIRAYYGSSTHSTKCMSRLIDHIVQDCKAVGIETLPPDKLSAMMAEYKPVKMGGKDGE